MTSPLTNSPTDKTVHFQGIVNGWASGTRVEAGQELWLVTEADQVNKTATVVRGWLGTTIVAHAVDDAVILKPRFLRSDVMDLINDALLDMAGRDLYAIGTQELFYDPVVIGYALDTSAIKVIRVDGELDFASFYWEPLRDWIQVQQASSDFPTGQSIQIRVALPGGALMRVTYTKMFTAVTDEADDLEVAGLRPYMMDLPYYFAMNRLMVDEERHRSQIEAAENHQRAQDTPPFLALRTGEWYQARYEDRVLSARKVLRDEAKVQVGTGYGT